MTPSLLSLLCCPHCRGELALQNEVAGSGRITAGTLCCRDCGNSFSIIGGIPRFVGELAHAHSGTAKNFGDAWTIYARRRKNPYSEPQFLDWISPLGKADFRGKVVLDLGSGLAGFAEFVAGYGPQQVVGLEISRAIDASIHLLAEHPNLNLVQGDILAPPFKPRAFDLIYSVGVLHHLEIPESGFVTSAKLVKRGGRFFIWVYGRENNEFVMRVVDPVRKVLSRLPVPLVHYAIAWPIGTLLFAMMHTLYHPVMKPAFGALPYSDYFGWLRQYGFGYVIGMVTDQLIPPRTNYHSREELLGWFERAGLGVESITARNNISWRVLGRSPL